MARTITKAAVAMLCLLALSAFTPQAKASGFDLFCATLSCGTASLSGTTWSSSNMKLNGTDLDGSTSDIFLVKFSANTSTGNGTITVTDKSDADLSVYGTVTGFTATPCGGHTECLQFTVVQWIGTVDTGGTAQVTLKLNLSRKHGGTIVSADIFGSSPEPASLLLLGTGLLGMGAVIRRSRAK